MASVFKAYLAYQFIKLLTTPWDETEAFKNGVVDKNGAQLKKTNQLKTSSEKKSFTVFHKIKFFHIIFQKWRFRFDRITPSFFHVFLLLLECMLCKRHE